MRSAGLVAFALAGCIRSGIVVCTDGRACPVGTVCDVIHATCVEAAQLAVCEAVDEGMSCEAGGIEGVCDQGVCLDLPPVFTRFETPMPVPGANTATLEEDDPTVTADMLELFLLRNGALYTAKRSGIEEPWPAPTLIAELDTPDTQYRPSVSADGLTLYFTERTASEPGDIYMTIRPTRESPWSIVSKVPLDLHDLPDTEQLCGWTSPDGLTMFVSSRSALGDLDLYIATRPAMGMPFTSVPFAELNSAQNDGTAWATADGSRIVFESNRNGRTDIWEAVRHRDTWALERHAELSVAAVNGSPWLSPDGTVIVFSTTPAGGVDDLYTATREPPP